MRYRTWIKVGLAKKDNMKQKTLANKLAIGQSYLSEIITGKKNPNSVIFSRIIEILEASPAEAIELELRDYWKDRNENL